MATVQTAMLGHLPFTVLRDAIFTHPTAAEGLTVLLADVASREQQRTPRQPASQEEVTQGMTCLQNGRQNAARQNTARLSRLIKGTGQSSIIPTMPTPVPLLLGVRTSRLGHDS